MNFFNLTWILYKRMIKDSGYLFNLFIMPLLLIIFISFTSNKVSYNDVGFYIEDKGVYSNDLVKVLNLENDQIYSTKEEALKALEKNDVFYVYHIKDGFSKVLSHGKVPSIECIKGKNSKNLNITDIQINKFIKEKLSEQVLINNKVCTEEEYKNLNPIEVNIEYKKSPIVGELAMNLMMITYFIILSSASICNEIGVLKSANILKRALTTANKPYKIIGSIYTSIFLVQTTLSIAVLMVSKVIFNFEVSKMLFVILIIMATSLISISTALLFTRILKKQELVSMVLVIVVVISMALSTVVILLKDIRTLPVMLTNLAKFTPQYWIMESIFSCKLFPNMLIVMLMTIVLFMAGNIKIKEFINN